ncbi:fumarylacetoacetate hydrolase family protein [Mesorhizobium sp. 1M-11]|uniref:2-keto-4-pentenoate hydratase n=1 Tax=Mesorhizobium sp. 1M-11 TaxID=1529006 RepID=UPI0006C7565F|nr:fumarylacetoacetate hydrolase family protein [Mesorhizobium sp. 1M-11]
MLGDAEIEKAARAISDAERNAAAMPPLSGGYPGLALADAYRIQERLNSMREQQGLAFAGYKIGLTWRTTQIACGLTEPICGRILADAVFSNNVTLQAAPYISPQIEVELAFVMACDVDAPLRTAGEALAVTDHVMPALELVDFRMAAPRIVADTVADNSAFAGVVLSSHRLRPQDVDTRWMGATLARNGVVEVSGVAAMGMGHPASCVAWLANTLLERGERLRAGDLIMSGAFAAALPVVTGDRFEADFGPCGGLEISFQ